MSAPNRTISATRNFQRDGWIKPASLALLMVLMGSCSTLPTAYSSPPTPRPVEPLPFEKKGYTIATPSPTIAPLTSNGAPVRTVIAVKAGKKLSQADLAALLEQADDKAVSASSLAESAQSKDDWLLAVSQWQKAIALLKPIANQDSAIRQKLSQYQRNLADAQTRSTTNPRQLVTEGTSGGYGVPLVIQSGEQTPSPSASPSPGASPAASTAPASSAPPLASPAPSTKQ